MPTARIPLVLVSFMYILLSMKTHRLIQGGYPLGTPESTTARVTDPAAAQELVDLMLRHGQKGIDTSRVYAQGTSEKVTPMLPYLFASLIDLRRADSWNA